MKFYERKNIDEVWWYIVQQFPTIGIIVAGYGSGHIRIFSVAEACIVAEAAAHAGKIVVVVAVVAFIVFVNVDTADCELS
jgi:hypothetical protein